MTSVDKKTTRLSVTLLYVREQRMAARCLLLEYVRRNYFIYFLAFVKEDSRCRRKSSRLRRSKFRLFLFFCFALQYNHRRKRETGRNGGRTRSFGAPIFIYFVKTSITPAAKPRRRSTKGGQPQPRAIGTSPYFQTFILFIFSFILVFLLPYRCGSVLFACFDFIRRRGSAAR